MKVGIIGVGKVGGALIAACQNNKNLTIVGAVIGHQQQVSKFVDGVPVYESAKMLLQAVDVLLLTVPDQKIAAVAKALAQSIKSSVSRETLLEKKICLHCSGSMGVEILTDLADLGIHSGSLHPLQSFANREATFTGIGMAVDGDEVAVKAGSYIANALGAKTFRVPPEERKIYHAAACFCSNYLVTVVALAQQLMARWTVDEKEALQVLQPLLQGTATNLSQVDLAREALSGPIARGDINTVQMHLEVLPKEFLEAYKSLGEQTIKLARANATITVAQAKQLLKLLQNRDDK